MDNETGVVTSIVDSQEVTDLGFRIERKTFGNPVQDFEGEDEEDEQGEHNKED